MKCCNWPPRHTPWLRSRWAAPACPGPPRPPPRPLPTPRLRTAASSCRAPLIVRPFLLAPRRKPRQETHEIVHVQNRWRGRAVAVGPGIGRGEAGLETHKVVDVQHRELGARVTVGVARG